MSKEEMPISRSLSGKLKELSLSFNHLTELDDDCFVGIEESLDILELSFAFATDVFPQRALRPLSNLLWLVLDNNNFQTIEATAFYSFQRLRYINLESNRLHYLPERIFLSSVHPELRDVKLGYNFLEAIPDFSFHNLTELRSLDLTGNRIKILNSDSIMDCPELVTLSLAYNRITKMEKNAFYGLPSLRFLHLEFNKLVMLDLDAIAEIGGPDFALNVSYNAISTINSGSFTNNLTRLDLSFNNISHLPADTFYGTPELKSLDLQSNFIVVLESGKIIFYYIVIVQFLEYNETHLINKNFINFLLIANFSRHLYAETLGNAKSAKQQDRKLTETIFPRFRITATVRFKWKSDHSTIHRAIP